MLLFDMSKIKTKSMGSAQKSMGFFNLLAIVIGTMVGIGIFIAPALTIQYGFYGALSCALAGLLCIGLAIMFGELSKVSFASGPSGFTYQAFGKVASLEVALLHWLGFVCAQILTVYTLGIYTKPEYVYYISVGLLVLVGIVNAMWPKIADSMQVGLTVLKIALVLFVIGVGLYAFNPSDFKLDALSWQDTGKTLLSGLTYFVIAFAGLELATLPSGAIKNPKFTIPAATIIGTIITAGLTVMVYVVVMNVLLKNNVNVSARPVYDVLSLLISSKLMIAFIAAFVVVCLSSVNGILSAQAFILKNAATIHVLPAKFKETNGAGQPVYAIAFSVIASILLLILMQNGVLPMRYVELISSLSFALVYFFSTMSYLKLRGSKLLWALNLITAILFLYGVVVVLANMLYVIIALIIIGMVF